MMKTTRRIPSMLVLALCLLLAPVWSWSETVNLLSLQEGCLPVVMPSSYSGWVATNLLDDSPTSGWACEQGQVANNVFVFELAEEAVLEKFQFDTASIDTAGSAAKQVIVEVSTASAKDGFKQVLKTNLAANTDGQNFVLNAKAPARWVRLTIVSNYGSPEYSELFSFKGFGEKPLVKESPAISGTYNSDYAEFHVLQEGAALSGCYEYDEGLLNGVIEGRVMKITWQESGGENDNGPAVMVFSPDGRSFKGYWWYKGAEAGPPSGTWDGAKISAQVGSCPHWSGSLGSELKKQLDATGRARIYGIRFAFNSAKIESASLPVLAEVIDLLKQEPGLNLAIEGHTDSIGRDEANQMLSQQRAEAVKTYLVQNGINAGRLSAAGYGESVPVASNDTELGRAQNRRVELVRQ